MTDTNTTASPVSAAKASALRYLSCLRPQDILVLQGPPLLGAGLAIGAPPAEEVVPLVLLMVANVFLVSHIFMLNDWSGLTTDFADPNKTARVFTARGVRRRNVGVLTVGLLVVSLLLFSGVGALVLSVAVAIATLSALYSLPRFNWKGRPLVNSLAHFTGGSLHFLLGYSISGTIDGRALAVATFFALIFTAGHLNQEVRDHQGDSMNGIRTNAVVFGQRRAFAASLVLFTLAQCLLLLLSLRGILPRVLATLVVLFPLQLHWSLQSLREGLTYRSVYRLQTRYRVLYAVVGLVMVIGFCVAPIAAGG
jgi:4-hydroxybenzoate polyprenyltransferase